MRSLINYIRSCFCKHDWELIGNHPIVNSNTGKIPVRRLIVYRCKKCGYVQKIKIN